MASDWSIPGQVSVGDVEAGQVGEVGGQRAEVEAAEVVGAEGQGLQLSQSWENDDVMIWCQGQECRWGLQMSLDSDSEPRKLVKLKLDAWSHLK